MKRTRPKGSKVLVVVVMVGSRTVPQRRYRSCPRIRLLPRQQEPRLDRHCQLEWARCSWSLSGHLGPVILVCCRNHGSLDYVRIMQFSTLSISTRLCNSPSCSLEWKLHGMNMWRIPLPKAHNIANVIGIDDINNHGSVYCDTHDGSSEDASTTLETTAASRPVHQCIEKGVDVFQHAAL
ncbi:hypothetical protein F2Q70_00018958 [Brassica cretica]|uniref:Uncharacterized protein n=1 Tax=Brassica cretica TaxID=69181 RepID=A0A8S9HU84_BRACR|nr:hypothetical protein F2Q70_00018958 [Brassica cretica]